MSLAIGGAFGIEESKGTAGLCALFIHSFMHSFLLFMHVKSIHIYWVLSAQPGWGLRIPGAGEVTPPV